MPLDATLLDRVRRARHSLAEAGPASERRPGDFDCVSVSSRDADVLRDWLVAEGARVVVEVGLANGASALAIAEALVTNGASDDAHLIIDAFQDQFDEAGWNVLVSTGLSGLCVLEREWSQHALACNGFVADAAFVDGSHLFHNVFVDLFFLRELVRPGGLVVLDDCDWPAVATAARYFELNAGWQLEPMDQETRLRAYRLPNPKVEPRFDKFTPFGLDTTG